MAVAPAPDDTRRAQAPYVAWKSFRAFFEKYDFVPTTVDRSLLKYTSGATATQILHALRVLEVILPDGSATPRMASLHAAFREGGDKAAVGQILRESYPTVFELDLMTTTPKMVRDKFDAMGLSGDTLRKSMSFFFAAAEEAGIPFAPHLKKAGANPKRATSANKSRPKSTAHNNRAGGSTPPTDPLRADGGATDARLAGLPELLTVLLADVPERQGTSWGQADRDKFLAAFTHVLDYCYPISDSN